MRTTNRLSATLRAAPRRGLLRAAGALSVVALLGGGLAACDRGGPKFHNTDVTGSGIAKDGFTLTDHTGATRTLADYRGKVVVMFFGFTHCPDVCPTTLVETAEAMKLLGSRADKVQVLFVTVDPERDTPEMLREFVPAFDPRFLGMVTDAANLKSLAHEYKVVYQKTGVKAPDDYLIDHSAGTYVYDPQGKLRLLVAYGSGPDDIAQDLKTLLGGY